MALSQGARVDASGNGGGTVLLRGGRLRVDRAFIFADNQGAMHGTGLGVDLRVTAEALIADGAFITMDSLGAGRACDLRLSADRMHLEAASLGSMPCASGAGGKVSVQVGRLTLAGGAVINSSTAPNSGGRGGQLTVTTTETIAIAGPGQRRQSKRTPQYHTGGWAGR
jgi:hypothetical protein